LFVIVIRKNDSKLKQADRRTERRTAGDAQGGQLWCTRVS